MPMIAKTRPTAADRARALLAVADAALSWPFRVTENRRLRSTLAALSDHALKDIGLTRVDLADATALPSGRDPGRFLAARRSERRRP